MLTIDDFALEDRVTWSVYGKVFTGTVKRIFTEHTEFYWKGDMLVQLDGEKRTVPVIIGRSVNKLPGKPFPFDRDYDDRLIAERRADWERWKAQQETVTT